MHLTWGGTSWTTMALASPCHHPFKLDLPISTQWDYKAPFEQKVWCFKSTFPGTASVAGLYMPGPAWGTGSQKEHPQCLHPQELSQEAEVARGWTGHTAWDGPKAPNVPSLLPSLTQAQQV